MKTSTVVFYLFESVFPTNPIVIIISGVAMGAQGERAHLIPLRIPVWFVQNRRVFLSGGGRG